MCVWGGGGVTLGLGVWVALDMLKSGFVTLITPSQLWLMRPVDKAQIYRENSLGPGQINPTPPGPWSFRGVAKYPGIFTGWAAVNWSSIYARAYPIPEVNKSEAIYDGRVFAGVDWYVLCETSLVTYLTMRKGNCH